MDASPDQIAGARSYDALFVPSLMAPFAPVVADAAGIDPGADVLDVACGTGIVAREAARRAGANGRVIGLDANPGMLAVARDQAPGVTWQHGRAEALPFPDGSFDAVVSQFGLMFFTDRRAAIREMRRVLRPGGHLAIAVWDALATMAAFSAEASLFQRLAGQRAADALRSPFVLGDRATLARLAIEGGLDTPAVECHGATARFPSVRVLVEADLRGWLPIMGVRLTESVIEATLAEADDALAPYVTATAEGDVSFATSALVLRAAVP